jgi:hypothetical protein
VLIGNILLVFIAGSVTLALASARVGIAVTLRKEFGFARHTSGLSST